MEPVHFSTENDEELQRELVHMARRNKARRNVTMALVTIVAIILACFAAWINGKNQMQKELQITIEQLQTKIAEQTEQIKKLKEEPLVVTPVSPRIDLENIYSKINDIAELATVEYLFTDAAEFSDYKQIFDKNIPGTKKSFIVRWEGVIKAGVDLKQVKIAVDEEKKKITVSIPSAKILSYSVDSDSAEVLDEKSNVFNPISVTDKIDFDAKTEEAMKKRAIENGILKKAKENAEDILTRLIQSDSAEENGYTIEFGRVN